MDEIPPSPQKEFELPPVPPAGPVTLESLQKQLHELQARFKAWSKDVSEEQAALDDQSDFLQKLLTGSLFALILLVTALCLFMGTQMNTVRAQLSAQGPAFVNQLNEFQSRLEPNIRNFASELHAFANQHPEFSPVVERYRPLLSAYFPPMAPALPNPAPAAASTNPAPR